MTQTNTSQLSKLDPTTEGVSPTKVRTLRPYIDVAEIRKAYPNPEMARGCGGHQAGDRRHYCVGGALVKFLGNEDKHSHFNGFCLHCIGESLIEANPNVKMGQFPFTSRNDRGDFEGAWQALKEALEYGIETKPE